MASAEKDGREAVQVLGQLVLVSFAAACLRGFLGGASEGAPSLFGVAPEQLGWRLVLWMISALVLLVASFPSYPARARAWWREALPLIAGAAFLLPGQPLARALPLPPEMILGALLLLALLSRRDHLGWRALIETVQHSLPNTRVRAVVIGLGAILLIYLLVAQFQEMERVATRTTDFGTFYRASMVLAEGGDPYRDIDGFLYAPTFARLFQPLLGLAMVDASLLWFVVKLTLVIWTFHLADALLRGAELSGRRRGWFLAGLVLVAGRFWVTDLQFGNTNVIVLFLTTATLAWSATRPTRAGFCLALAVTVKVIPLVLAGYLVVTQRWRALAWTAIFLAVLNLVPLAMEPQRMVTAWESYLEVQGAQSVTDRRDQPDNQSLWGALARTLPGSVTRVRAVWAAMSVLLALYAAWATWRARRRGELALAAAASLWPLLGLIVSPGSWLVHYVAMLLPMAALLRLLLAGAQPSRPLWILFWTANAVLTASGWFRWSVHLAADHSLFLLTAVVVFLAVGWLAARGAWTVDDQYPAA